MRRWRRPARSSRVICGVMPIYTVLRLLGDAMGGSSNRSDEETSADVYRYLLCTGLACASDATDADFFGSWVCRLCLFLAR